MYPDNNFTRANFMAHLEAVDKIDLFEKLCHQVSSLPQIKASDLSFTIIKDAIFKREQQASTALGNGIIMPHARLSGLDHLAVIIASLKTPIPNSTPDNQPLNIACLLLIPENRPMEGLKFIARFANYVRMPELREELLMADTPEAMHKQLDHLNAVSQKTIVAGDIMEKCSFHLTAKQPLKEATALMAKYRTSVVPVLNGNKLEGQIACTSLFTLGIPDFFSQLKSVGFIRFFDPFEKYFHIEAHSNVGEVMSSDCCTFYEDATLIEIVFAISILKYPQVYVINKDHELLGIIDQSLLLEKIINL